MEILHGEPPAKIERYRTGEGEEFVIRRRPRPGRMCQKPEPTGEVIGCPFCGQEHDVVSYVVKKGRKGLKKCRSWDCPKTGKLPLNQGRQWDEYVGSIIVRHGSEVEPSPHREAQTFDGVQPQPSSPVEVSSETCDGMEQLDSSDNQEPKLKLKITPSPQRPRSLAEFPVAALVRPAGIGRFRRDLPESCSSALRCFIDKSPRLLDRLIDNHVSGIKKTGRTLTRGLSSHILSPEKLLKFRTT